MPSIIITSLLLISCIGRPNKRISINPETSGAGLPGESIITDYQNKSVDGNIPEWVELYLNKDTGGIEALPAFESQYVFIARNEGDNFTALTHWANSFTPGLDFPRLAAARIEKRFSSQAPIPDQEYGSFYEELIRTASDFRWTGAVKADNYWIRREYTIPNEDDILENKGSLRYTETWEFLILVIINKTHFASQLESVFKNTKPLPPPNRDQNNAVNRVKERFFEGF